MTGPYHTTGRAAARHRRPPGEARTGPYDPAQVAAAGRLQDACPHWVILYGPWTRRHFAFPRFPAPAGTILSAPSTDELREWMRTTELEARPGPPPRPGGR
jgi:hypothetical protein